MTEKKFFELTDRKIIALIKTGNVRHKRCDVCGCELAMLDAGVYVREGLTTTVCTTCSHTKQHYDLLAYIEDLKKSHSKKEILEILDKRMEGTWGDASIFTIEEWEEQTKEERYRYCPECGKRLEIEESFFGFFLTCNDCGLGLGCNKKGKIGEQNKKSWEEWEGQTKE